MAYTGTTAAILSNYSEVLKTFYLPAIQEQLNNGTVLASMLETNETDVAGKNATINLHYGRNSGTGARADGGSLPDAGYQKHQTCTVPMRYQYGRVTFSGPTIAATRDQKGSYANVVDNEIQGITKDLMMEVNRQLWGCGYGIVARWRTTGSGTSYTLQRSYRGNTAGGDGFGSTFGGKYIKPNGNNSAVPVVMTEASAVITATTVDATDIAVSAVVETPLLGYDTITCTDPSVTEAVGTYYVRPGAAPSLATTTAAGTGRYEMVGLRGIVTDTDLDDIALFSGTSTSNTAPIADGFQNLVVGTYTWWKAIVDAHSAGRYGGQRALTFKLMDKMFDKVEENAGKDYGPDVVITTRAIRREYKELCEGDRRMVNTMTLDGGWKALEYNGIPLMVDDDAIDGEIYFLTMRDLQIYRMSDYNWMDKDGSIMSRISGYDAYEAVLYRYAELGCKRRNSQGVLCDISYDVG
jgi:hypothetical protein